MGWKYGVKLSEESDLSYNALVFATEDEAHRGGRELLSRWFSPISYHVSEFPELSPNYEFPIGAVRATALNESMLRMQKIVDGVERGE